MRNKYFIVDGGKYHEFYQYNSIEVYLLVILLDQCWCGILAWHLFWVCHRIGYNRLGMQGAILIPEKLMIDFIFVESFRSFRWWLLISHWWLILFPFFSTMFVSFQWLYEFNHARPQLAIKHFSIISIRFEASLILDSHSYFYYNQKPWFESIIFGFHFSWLLLSIGICCLRVLCAERDSPVQLPNRWNKLNADAVALSNSSYIITVT